MFHWDYHVPTILSSNLVVIQVLNRFLAFWNIQFTYGLVKKHFVNMSSFLACTLLHRRGI